MAENTEYFSMQGRVYLGLRNSDGSRAPARWVYDASTLEAAMSTDRENKNESYSGVRGLAATLTTGRTLTLNLTLVQLNVDNAALATDGIRVDLAAGSVVDESIGAVVAGDVVALDYAAISNLVLEDSASAALTEDTDYTVNLDTGLVTFLTTKAGVTGSYDYAAHSLVKVFESERPEFYALFDGLNTVDGAAKRCRGEFNRISFPPAETLALINESFGEISLAGDGKIDPVRQTDPKFGLYGRVILVDPA